MQQNQLIDQLERNLLIPALSSISGYDSVRFLIGKIPEMFVKYYLSLPIYGTGYILKMFENYFCLGPIAKRCSWKFDCDVAGNFYRRFK